MPSVRVLVEELNSTLFPNAQPDSYLPLTYGLHENRCIPPALPRLWTTLHLPNCAFARRQSLCDAQVRISRIFVGKYSYLSLSFSIFLFYTYLSAIIQYR